MADKETIRPVYYELQGCLTQAPEPVKAFSTMDDEQAWNHYHSIIDELNELTGKDYNKFRVVPERGQVNFKVNIGTYRQKLGGLIARLHGTYFSDEPAPFASMPSTIITQSQNQSVHVEFLLEMSYLISDKMNKAKEGTPEKKFLEKIRGTLSKVKNASQFVTLVIITAKEMGISLDQLASLFS